MGGVNGGTPNPMAKLLGEQWQPGPMGWAWMKGEGPGGAVHILVLETPVGRIGFTLNENDLAEFIRQAQTQLTGLVLPGPGEVQL